MHRNVLLGNVVEAGRGCCPLPASEMLCVRLPLDKLLTLLTELGVLPGSLTKLLAVESISIVERSLGSLWL